MSSEIILTILRMLVTIIIVIIVVVIIIDVIIVIVSGGSKPSMVFKPSGDFPLLAIRSSFPTTLDGGGCEGESEVIVTDDVDNDIDDDVDDDIDDDEPQ